MSVSAIWNEHAVLYERMKRRLKEYEASRPKPKVNWDRNAKREKVVPAQVPKAKPKPKPKVKKEETPKEPSIPNANDMVFEDIEFKTPPLTPLATLPPPVAAAPVPDYMEKDDFWDFYDNPLPLP